MNKVRIYCLFLMFLLTSELRGQIDARLSTGGDSRIKDVLALKNGGYIAVGQHFTYNDSITIPNAAFLLDSAGTKVLSLYFGQDGYNKKNQVLGYVDKRIKSAVQLPSGEIFLFGHQRILSTKNGLWMVQLKEDLTIVKDTVYIDIPVTNAYYMRAQVANGMAYVTCQTTEVHRKTAYRDYTHLDARVICIDQDLNIRQQWTNFATTKNKEQETLDFFDASLDNNKIYMAFCARRVDSLGTYEERSKSPIIKVIKVDLAQQGHQLFYQDSTMNMIQNVAVQDSMIYITTSQYHQDSMKKYTSTNYLIAIDHLSYPLFKKEYNRNSDSRHMLFHNKKLLLLGNSTCKRGQYRFIQVWNQLGEMEFTDTSFCDYNKESVGGKILPNGQLLEYFIDNGWYMRTRLFNE